MGGSTVAIPIIFILSITFVLYAGDSPHTFSVVSGENTLTVRTDPAASPECPRDTDLVLTFIVP